MWKAVGLLLAGVASPAIAERPGCTFPVYQFAADAIPRVDGDAADWSGVGGAYAIGLDRLAADDGSGARPDPKSLAGTVRVGWVKGLNRLYILYEATDDYWDFASTGLDQDIFELVVDGDRSGGPLIARFHPDLGADDPRHVSDEQAWSAFQNVQAQNYHIFTPARNKDWAMAWGPQAAWIKRLPWSNIASRGNLVPGRPGRLTMEFWITPFDHADASGPARSVESQLVEGKAIGMAWAVIDRDGPATKQRFWNLSPHHTMYGQASLLCDFRLMPRDPAPAMQADWSFAVVDAAARRVAFRDETSGATAWDWDFGDGAHSRERHPVHDYATPGKFVVVLRATGAAGVSTLSKVWDVSFAGDPPR